MEKDESEKQQKNVCGDIFSGKKLKSRNAISSNYTEERGLYNDGT